MAFKTPCFVRVEDAAERKKLIEWCNNIIGRSGDEDYMYGNVVLCIRDTTYCCIYQEADFVSDDDTIDCGTSVELFRALAAMNDENDWEQWFTNGREFGKKKGIQKINGNDVDIWEMHYCPIGEEHEWRKATAEEIVEYFKKK